MHNRAAVSWQHMLESCQRAIYISQVRNFGDSLEVLRGHLFDGRKTDAIALFTQMSMGPRVFST